MTIDQKVRRKEVERLEDTLHHLNHEYRMHIDDHCENSLRTSIETLSTKYQKLTGHYFVYRD